MRRHRFERDPVVWIIFAVAVAVPSYELLRLRNAAHGPAAAQVATIEVVPFGRSSVAPPADQPHELPRVRRSTPRRTDPAAPVRAEPTHSDPDDSLRFVPVSPTRSPIAGSILSPWGDLVVVLEESGTVTVTNIAVHKQVSSFDSGMPTQTDDTTAPPPMSVLQLGDPRAVGPRSEHAPLVIGGRDGRMRSFEAYAGKALLAVSHGAQNPRHGRSKDNAVTDVSWFSYLGALSVTEDGSLALWNGHSRPDSARGLVSPGGRVSDLAFASEIELVVAASDSGVHAVGPMEHQWVPIVTARPGISPRRVAVSLSGDLVASSWSDGKLRVHRSGVTRRNVGSGGMLRYIVDTPLQLLEVPYPGHSSPWHLALSRDGTTLAAAGSDSTIYFWPLAERGKSGRTTVRGPVTSLWFTPHGQSVVVSVAGEHWLRELRLDE